MSALVVRRVASFLLPISGTFCVLAPLLGILAIQILKQSVLTYSEQTAYASLIQIDYGIYVAVLGSVIVWIGYFNSRLAVSGRIIVGAIGLVVLVLFSSLLATQFPLGIFQHEQQQLMLQSYRFPIGGPLDATFRNNGATTLNMRSSEYSFHGVMVLPKQYPGCYTFLPQDTSCSVTLDVSYALQQLTPGSSYPLKVILSTGITAGGSEHLTFFNYSVTYGSS